MNRWVLLALLAGCSSNPGSTAADPGSTSAQSDPSETAGDAEMGSAGSSDIEPADCELQPGAPVVLKDRVVLHDFNTPVTGCAADFGPSGIDYHPGLDVLVVASDKGQYALMSPDGEDVSCHDLPGDNEGVTVVYPRSPVVVFAVEGGAGDGAGLLQVVDLSKHAVLGTHVVAFEGGAVANAGVEALAWTAGVGSVQPGFALGDQTLGELRSGCDVPWQDPSDATPRACSQRWSVAGMGEITGADADASRGLLWLSSDDDDRLVAVGGPEADPVFDIALPADSGPGQEGHAVVGCTLLLSLDANDDARQVLRYTMAPG